MREKQMKRKGLVGLYKEIPCEIQSRKKPRPQEAYFK